MNVEDVVVADERFPPRKCPNIPTLFQCLEQHDDVRVGNLARRLERLEDADGSLSH